MGIILSSSPLTGEGRGEGERKKMPPPLSSPEVGEEG